ncbi:MAG: phage portal protein [Rhodobiaceae bacterium]|nr:phage portal protein [Rhodobiaceae bacterium]MCC0055904.1 phage portal protein [Rhodobiaceae bacterium]
MTIYSSPFLAPIRWAFGWRQEAKIAGGEAAYPEAMMEYGRDVGVNGALQIATVWACIRLLAETVSTLPVMVYRSEGDQRRVAKEHPLFALLHDAPNADMTALEFWEGVVSALCTFGNAYAEKKFSGSRIVALMPLRADAMEIYRNARGRRRYRYHDEKGNARELDEDQVFHVRGFGNGGDIGLSPIAYARYTLFGARMADRASAEIFATGNRQQGVLEVSSVLKPDQRSQIRENILKPFIEGKTLVLEAGMKFAPTTLSPEDAQMLESRAFQVEEICRWFRVPPFMIGHTEKSTSWGTGLEQQQLGFLTFALEPYLERIEQAIRRSLIAPGERGSISAEFKVEKLLRADSAARAAFYQTMTQIGAMTINEVRGLENMPPVEGGDVPRMQMQNVPITEAGSTTLPANEEQKP